MRLLLAVTTMGRRPWSEITSGPAANVGIAATGRGLLLLRLGAAVPPPASLWR